MGKDWRDGHLSFAAESERRVLNLSISIVMAYDHSKFREVLRNILEKEQDFLIIGEAEDGRTAVKLTLDLSPDVVLMDVNMHGLNGIEATRQIIFNRPSAKIIGLSIDSTPQIVTGMLSAGCKGYLLKETVIEELRYGIRTVSTGGVCLSRKITDGTEFSRSFKDGKVPAIFSVDRKKEAGTA